MSNIEKFLEFNGKRLSVLSKDGQWWLALRPILDALNVDPEWHIRAVKTDEILAQHLCDHTVVAADNKLRKMMCLPERYIYGWLFSIRSESAELVEYKRTCYDVLYNHFHSSIADRMEVLNKQDQIDLRILELQEKLQESDEYREILDLKKLKTKTGKDLKRLDVELKTKQLSFSFS